MPADVPPATRRSRSSPGAAASVATLADSVAARIQRMIVDGDVDVGERLPAERELAGRFETSRPTVSQALRALSLMGILEIRRGSGAYVLRRPRGDVTASVTLQGPMQADALAALLRFRLWLEREAVTEAASRTPPVSRAELDALRGALKRLQTARTPSEWIAADTVFHAMIVGASANAWLTAVFESVHTTAVSFQFKDWVRDETVPDWLAISDVGGSAIHPQILEAVIHRDTVAAGRAVERHHEVLMTHLDLPARPDDEKRGARGSGQQLCAARTPSPGVTTFSGD